MGYSTTWIDVKEAKKITKKGEVVSASCLQYFGYMNWKRNVIKAEKVEGKNTIFFKLLNNDFVEVEY